MPDQAEFKPSFFMRFLPYGIVLILLIGVVVLEVFLAKKKNKFVGLIPPAVFLLLSFIIVMMNITGTSAPWQTGIDAIIFALICNVPTAVLIMIYFVCRNAEKQKRALNKMNLQDLE